MGASNKPKGDVWASVQDHIRSYPKVFSRWGKDPCSLVDSGAQVTVINNECFKECMKG